MGWWSTNRKGESFSHEDGVDMVWGDGPADIFDDAIVNVINIFKRDFGRKPTIDELVAGLMFSAPVILDEE